MNGFRFTSKMGFQTYSVIHRKYEFFYQSNCITSLGLCANRWNCLSSGTRCGSLKHNWTKMTYKNRTYINVWEKSPECLWVETFFKNLVNNIKKKTNNTRLWILYLVLGGQEEEPSGFTAQGYLVLYLL